MTTVFYILLGFLAVIAAAGVVANVRRQRALAALAGRRQWELTWNDRQLPEDFSAPPFGVGHRRVAKAIVRGRHHGRAVLAFDYEYHTPGKDGDDTHHAWVACVEDLPVTLPVLDVVARTVIRGTEVIPHLGRMPGLQDFVSGDPDFDRRYYVYTDDLRLAADILGPEVLRLLASWPDFSWRVEGNRLLTWGTGWLKPHWIETNLNMLVALAEAVPDEVWRTARG